MVKVMTGLPKNVIGIEATGTVTREDYENIIIPEVERHLKDFKKIKFLYRMTGDFKGLTPGAMWDDLKVGTAHFSAWQKCAVVTESAWIRDIIQLLKFMMPCDVKIFKNCEFEESKRWIEAD